MNDPHPIDRMLSDFFRHERPNPWPAVRTPVPAVPARMIDSGSRNRLTLAVSAAVLFGIGVCLSSGVPSAKPSAKGGAESLVPGSTASGERFLTPRPVVEPPAIPMP